VLYGQGQLRRLNVVDKAPSFGTPRLKVGTSGSFNTTNIGIGVTTHVGSVWIRADFSRSATELREESVQYDGGHRHGPLEAVVHVDVQFTVDWLEDNPSNYYGTPLVPASFATQPLTESSAHDRCCARSADGVRQLQFSDSYIHSSKSGRSFW